jgi:hypothetical protein
LYIVTHTAPATSINPGEEEHLNPAAELRERCCGRPA